MHGRTKKKKIEVMLIMLLDCHEILHHEFVPEVKLSIQLSRRRPSETKFFERGALDSAPR